MARIEQEEVKGGKIVLRVTSGEHKGDLAGSWSAAAFTPPTASATPAKSATPSPDSARQVATAYARYLQTKPTPDLSDPAVAAQDLAFRVAMLAPTGLDEHQTDEILTKLATNAHKISKNNVDSQAPAPDASTWNEWVYATRARITDPANGLNDEQRTELLTLWTQISEGPIPDGRTFYAMRKAQGKLWAAKEGMPKVAGSIAGWMGVDSAEVLAQVDRFRAEYLARTAAGDTPEPPPSHYALTVRGNMTTTIPRDPATMWAFHQADNPLLYPKAPKTELVEGAEPKQQPLIVALDLETTGLDFMGHKGSPAQIVEVGIVRYTMDGEIVDRRQWFVRAYDEDGNVTTGSEETIAVHHITTAETENAPTFGEMLPELRECLEGNIVVGHNSVDFDMPFLEIEMRRKALRDEDVAPNWGPSIDTMQWVKRNPELFEDVPLLNNKLHTVAPAFGVPYTNGHRADHDADVAGRLFFALREQYITPLQETAAHLRDSLGAEIQ